jgi:hypothetical protein
MRQGITSLVLLLDMAICPFACHGLLATFKSGDTCCPAEKPCSDGTPPTSQGPQDDGSCGSCLCGGATNPDETRADFDITQSVTLDAQLPVLAANPLSLNESPTFDLQADDPGLILPGGTVRALLQTFLL